MTQAEKTAKIKEIDAKIVALKVSLSAAMKAKSTLMTTQITTEAISLYDLIPENIELLNFVPDNESEINKKVIVEILKELAKESSNFPEFNDLIEDELFNKIKTKYKQDLNVWLGESTIKMLINDTIKYINNKIFNFGKKVGVAYTYEQFFNRFG